MSFGTPYPYIAVLAGLALFAVVVVFLFGVISEEVRSKTPRRYGARESRYQKPVAVTSRIQDIASASVVEPVMDTNMELQRIEHKREIASLTAQIHELKVKNASMNEAYQNIRKELAEVRSARSLDVKKTDAQIDVLRKEIQDVQVARDTAVRDRDELEKLLAVAREARNAMEVDAGKATLATTEELSRLAVEKEDILSQLRVMSARMEASGQAEATAKAEAVRFRKEFERVSRELELKAVSDEEQGFYVRNALAEKQAEIDGLQRANEEQAGMILNLDRQLAEIRLTCEDIEVTSAQIHGLPASGDARQTTEQTDLVSLRRALGETTLLARRREQEIEELRTQLAATVAERPSLPDGSAEEAQQISDDAAETPTAGAPKRARRL